MPQKAIDKAPKGDIIHTDESVCALGKANEP